MQRNNRDGAVTNRMILLRPLPEEVAFNRGGSGMQQLGFCHDASIIADGTARQFSKSACIRPSRTI